MGQVYRGSDGRFYSERDLWIQYEEEAWEFRTGYADGREVVETEGGGIIVLTPFTGDGMRIGTPQPQ